MVTLIDRKCVGTSVTFTFAGKSSDKKPIASNGSKFIEMDTGKELFFDGEEQGWSEQKDKYLEKIEITTAPTKVAYQEGDTFDGTGMVVTATYTDKTTQTISASAYAIEVSNPLTMADTKAVVKYVENGRTRTAEQAITVSSNVPNAISITTVPTKTTYIVGETLDLTGIVVTAYYDSGDTVDVTEGCTFSPADGTELTEAETVTITATYEELTDDTTVTVSEPPELKSIAWTSSPKVNYTEGEALDLTGAVITATYTDDSTAIVTDQCTFNPVEGTELSTENTRVTASYTEGEITKTSYKVLTVTEQ